ncbi:hypothetical protein A3A60_04395 [Candidatus Curtissbacteria bacterium RIFCSPLOWO2_01_FULL_42_26]|uniref:Major facilitator superfamily (MFS) profile domain-containing protein n=1 Tax=Candidatus Curtissbacteria bacterium RIFCSPLOWO2_01_FULL_42_26 TaxID=1797729 RepID=A0A1F5HVE3_9BACT|nr:MAG: hypothetical protein A3A60_04395 [Candidatus Curtissbacteria bacterium RIFCSPLOWO2_01_FULL_42_26]
MLPILNKYLKLLKNTNFLLLILVIFIGQAASAFLVLALIVSVFKQTGSNFGVSGVILSFALPSFLLMAVSGLVADLFDRKIIIIFANTFIALVVLLILVSKQAFYASIPLAFLYFAGNSFFIPASSAATAQLVKKRQLLLANSLFISALAGGVIIGLFLAAVISFFAGAQMVLIICEALLISAAALSLFLPKLLPRKRANFTIIKTLADIWKGFDYIFDHKVIWFFFGMFALIQGIIAFGITLAPGFFEEIVGVSIEKSPLLIFPLIGIGVLLGIAVSHLPGKKEGTLVSLGLAVLGLATATVGGFVNVFGTANLIFVPVVFFLIAVGLGSVVVLIASRAALQENVSHHYQGTVFGANIILASFFSGLFSPAAATFEAIWGYANLLLGAGIVITLVSFFCLYAAKKWQF